MAHLSEIINTKGHPFVGVEWSIKGSKGNFYKVEMLDRGFECNCPAFKKCKHIVEVEYKFTDEFLEEVIKPEITL